MLDNFPTKIDPRVNRTRQLLEQALSDLLTKKRFSQITVQDITEKAAVNRATFYAHFEDKYSLLNYSVRKTFQAMLDAKLPPNPQLTRQNLRLLCLTSCAYIDSFIGNCVLSTQRLDHFLMVSQVQLLIHETLLGWVQQTDLPADSPAPEQVAMIFSGALFGASFRWVQMGRPISAEAWADSLLLLLINGLDGYLQAESAGVMAV